MGQMNDGSECLLCELWQDVDDESDLELCCKECRGEIAWAFARRRQVMNDVRTKEETGSVLAM